jgi:hypothetical protein
MKTFLPGLAIGFRVATIVLPITQPAVRRAVPLPPKACAETLKQREAELMKAAAEKGSQGSMLIHA